MRKIALVYILTLITISCFAQRGKNGSPTITGAQVVNEYTTLTLDASAGSTSITVANSALNTNARFSANLTTGDLVMIIQMQGATILGSSEPAFYGGNPNIGYPFDSTYGEVIAYNNCGNYEFAQVVSVPNSTTIQFDCGLTHNYTAAGKVQVIRVPRYSTLTLNNGDTVTCDKWDSATGGIVAIEVLGNTIINSGGCINVSDDGFRGGRLDSSGAGYGINYMAAFADVYGKDKGEGIGGFEWSYDKYGGHNCRGAAANAGGGGNGQNAGGGGGANGGDTTKWIDGIGNPDLSTANNIAAWKLEYTWLGSPTNRTGGGRGGYTFSSKKLSPITTGPNNAAWSGDNRDANGGLGGRPLNYSTGRIFMGGGGGAGDQNDADGGAGGVGGGIAYIVSYGTTSGSGQIEANGGNGASTGGPAPNNSYNGKDGAGGGGGGGAIIINSIGNISGISIQAKGGVGGNQVLTPESGFIGTITEAEGPGGGGGGGHIALSGATGVTMSVQAGANGTTNSPTMKLFLPNGATSGGIGDTSRISITNFKIVASPVTVCNGQSAALSASLTGTVPSGATINWFSTSSGGSAIATGTSYTTGVLTKDTVIYVGTCPGTYRQAVNVIISGSASISAGSPVTICNGNSTTLSASGGTSYTWSPAASLSNSAIANPIATPTTTTTYTVNANSPCGAGNATIIVTVTPSPVITVSSTSPTICSGSSTTLSENGGQGTTTYSWSAGSTGTSVTVSPLSTTTYTLTAITGTCTITPTTTITVNTTPTIVASGAATICSGSSAILTASGATTYTWSPAIAATTSTVSVSPTSSTTYSVTGTTATCTGGQQTVVVNVNPSPTISVNPPSPGICSGSSVGLTASGANTYIWKPNTSLTATTGANITASPASTITYTVLGSLAGCTDSTTVTVTVGSSLTASISGSDTVCMGNSTALTASGGSTYQWSGGSSSTNASITVSPNSPTTYSVLVESGTCKDSAHVTVQVIAALTATITGNTSICTGEKTTLTGGGGSAYVWSGGSTATTSSISVSPASTTTYSLQVSKGSCTATTSAIVTVNTPPVPTINNASTICEGTSIPLSASGGTSYNWLPAGSVNIPTSANPTATPLVTTVYTVAVSNGSCTVTDSVKITVTPSPIATVCCDATVLNGQSAPLVVTPALTGQTYSWSPSTGLACATCASVSATPATTTTYSVAIADSEGCVKTDSVIITVQENCGEVFIPKAFSPNNDGQNDVLYVRGDCIKSMDFTVFDRWGNKVFESTELSSGWDGTYNGQPMNAGTYVYYLTGMSVYDKPITLKGNVALVR